MFILWQYVLVVQFTVLKERVGLIREGGDARESRDEPLVHADAAQEHLLIEELVVVVQQDGGPVHGGEAHRWDAHLGSAHRPGSARAQ